MHKLSVDIFNKYICPYLTGKLVDTMVWKINKQFRQYIEDPDYKNFLFNLYWIKKEQYENGILKYLYYIKDGKREGLMLKFHNNGLVRISGLYIEGLREGIHGEWFENGKIYKSTTFINGIPNGSNIKWNNIGNVVRWANYKNNKRDGHQIIWDDNDQPKFCHKWKKCRIL